MSYAERLLESYPNAKHAVSWVELILCDRHDPDDREPTGWEILTSGYPPLTLDEIRNLIKGCIENEERHKSHLKNREALAELDTQDFTRYLAGKMGMV